MNKLETCPRCGILIQFGKCASPWCQIAQLETQLKAAETRTIEVRGERDQLLDILRKCFRNDRSEFYSYGEHRPLDGKEPTPGGRWATPREIIGSIKSIDIWKET